MPSAPDVVAEHYGFRCEYTPTIMSGAVFRWTRDNLQWVSASRDGVDVSFGRVLSPACTGVLVRLIELARATAERLAAGCRGLSDNRDEVKQFLRDFKEA